MNTNCLYIHLRLYKNFKQQMSNVMRTLVQFASPFCALICICKPLCIDDAASAAAAA